nr:DNA adenine methylase [Chromobacterium sp. ASV5]
MAVTRPALRYHGGKWMLAPWIIQHFPEHRVYTEPFGGAASVLLRKPRAKLVEIYNELDPEIVNLFQVLRDPEGSDRLQNLLRLTPFARAEFDLSYDPAADPVEQARRTCVRSFMGFGSDAASGATSGFRTNGNRQSAHPARDWSNYPAALAGMLERLAGVVIENRLATDVILQHDAPQTLHYCDPPYVLQTRSSAVTRNGKGYKHEMTDDDHAHLAQILHECAGMVVLSGYDSPLYNELYASWDRTSRKALADGARERTEVLWLNPACSAALHQNDLFKEIA